jgi:hypothetical protein
MLSIKKPEELFQLFENKSMSYKTFLKTYKVKSSSKLTPLEQYIREHDIDRSKVKILYENIINRNEYLERFYQISLKPTPLKIEYPAMKYRELNNNKYVQYKNVIRNMHFFNILQNTKSGIGGIPTFLDVLYDLYQNSIIDYKILTPSAMHYIQEGRLASVFSSFYFRASIMNPYLVYSLNKSVLKGTRVFTPTLGWTSYLYGFMECEEVIEYVGTDVIPHVCKKTADFAKKNYPDKTCEIYCDPSETFLKNPRFLKKYANHFDLVFFSPPYYELEKYPGKLQSTITYESYKEWLDGYWRRTMEVCYHVLGKGGKLCYILSDYGMSNSIFQLVKDMGNITREYFRTHEIIPMYNKNVHVTEHRETAEKICIFLK